MKNVKFNNNNKNNNNNDEEKFKENDLHVHSMLP